MIRATLCLVGLLFSLSADAGPLLRSSQLEAASPPPSTGVQVPLWLPVAGGVAAAVVATPAAVALGGALGTLSPSLVVAGLPALVGFLALPPLAVTLAEWLLFRGEGFRTSLSPALWVGLGAQLAVLAGAILLGADAQSFGQMSLLTLVEAVVLPAAVTWSMRPSATPMPATLSLPDGKPLAALPKATVLPLFAVAL